ncbi:MAG: DUF3412 domain-containing protein [Desulfovibrio sp.]|nr:MAG: DUF3412 domain-containing protein [Desulfovibrio sp.]
MKTDLWIPILHKKLGMTEDTTEIAERISRGIADEGNRFVEIVGALINIHKRDYHDAREIRVKFEGMTTEVSKQGRELFLYCRNVPMGCLYDGKQVIWASVEQISAAIRDIIFPPAMPQDFSQGVDVSAYVKKFVEHAGFLYRGERGLVVFTWGGHRVNRKEYEFAKQVGYWTALQLPDMENITGCGDGIMKAPFKGAQVAYGKQCTLERFGKRDFIGFTEKNILAAEPPNEVVNRFVVFPNIEQRMEAFIRASHRGRAHPGGPGTIEEILTMLALLSDPHNREIPFEFDLVEQPGGEYFKALQEYLHTCFGNAVDGMYTIFLDPPHKYAQHLAETTKKLPMRYLWNDDFRFDPRFQKPFEVTFESMEALDLTRDQEPMDLLINLRRFFSSIVHLSVRDPDMLDSWGDERPLIRGDKKIVTATNDLVKRLEDQDRIHPNKKYATPFRIE